MGKEKGPSSGASGGRGEGFQCGDALSVSGVSATLDGGEGRGLGSLARLSGRTSERMQQQQGAERGSCREMRKYCSEKYSVIYSSIGEGKPATDATFATTLDSHYSPQVEAISPTVPGESLNLREESPMQSHKDALLQKISRVDREIALAESHIAKLKKKLQEVEEADQQQSGKTGSGVDDLKKEKDESGAVISADGTKEPKHLSTRQKIYSENKKKAMKAHSTLTALGPPIESASIFLFIY
ncbi:unnamed protein product [Notodromas monacha]|uniref:N-CoR GPS2-interacting domain-containing protein n=1 Tax=Notodromas monacha TaxID=399045 RepID=A0A7R9GF23_9CRUS|nr:unnamed protein product [Notodromas monacha]CAG0918666.1 unnamed protein product [Notodromas monacha]